MRRLRKAFNIPLRYSVPIVVCIGYAADNQQPKTRRFVANHNGFREKQLRQTPVLEQRGILLFIHTYLFAIFSRLRYYGADCVLMHEQCPTHTSQTEICARVAYSVRQGSCQRRYFTEKALAPPWKASRSSELPLSPAILVAYLLCYLVLLACMLLAKAVNQRYHISRVSSSVRGAFSTKQLMMACVACCDKDRSPFMQTSFGWLHKTVSVKSPRSIVLKHFHFT